MCIFVYYHLFLLCFSYFFMDWHVGRGIKETICTLLWLVISDSAVEAFLTLWVRLSDWGQCSLIGQCQKDMCCDKCASSQRSEEKELGRTTPPHCSFSLQISSRLLDLKKKSENGSGYKMKHISSYSSTLLPYNT